MKKTDTVLNRKYIGTDMRGDAIATWLVKDDQYYKVYLIVEGEFTTVYKSRARVMATWYHKGYADGLKKILAQGD
jgi:hypothetical protein